MSFTNIVVCMLREKQKQEVHVKTMIGIMLFRGTNDRVGESPTSDGWERDFSKEVV